MGWTAHYQIVRDHILDVRELEKLAKLVRTVQKRKWDGEAFGLVAATAPRPSHVIARGWNKLGMSQHSFDRTLLEQMPAALRGNSYRFSSLVETLVTTPQFLLKRVPVDAARVSPVTGPGK